MLTHSFLLLASTGLTVVSALSNQTVLAPNTTITPTLTAHTIPPRPADVDPTLLRHLHSTFQNYETAPGNSSIFINVTVSVFEDTTNGTVGPPSLYMIHTNPWVKGCVIRGPVWDPYNVGNHTVCDRARPSTTCRAGDLSALFGPMNRTGPHTYSAYGKSDIVKFWGPDGLYGPGNLTHRTMAVYDARGALVMCGDIGEGWVSASASASLAATFFSSSHMVWFVAAAMLAYM